MADNLESLRSDRLAVSVTVERRIPKVYLTKLSDRRSATKTQALNRRLSHLPRSARRTLTFDNGSENSGYQLIAEEPGLKVYFCQAYPSWEKGTVGNTIGRLRRFLPKGESLEKVSEERIRLLGERFKDTPRKCLNFLTPNEVEAKMLSRLRR